MSLEERVEENLDIAREALADANNANRILSDLTWIEQDQRRIIVRSYAQAALLPMMNKHSHHWTLAHRQRIVEVAFDIARRMLEQEDKAMTPETDGPDTSL